MMVSPPVAGVNVGHSAGGGLMDTFKNTIAGITGGTPSTPGQVDPGPKGDGSVGLFDGVLKKALLGGAAGVAMGFIPFLPGGPVLGGIVGALGGAAMGVATNWMKQNQIKKENEATLAAMGVQVQDPNIQQVLQTGNVGQLIPMMQSAQQGGVQQGAATQMPVTQTSTGQKSADGIEWGDVTPEEVAAIQQQAIAEGRTPGPVSDPATAQISQSPVPTQGLVAVGSGAGAVINPAYAVNPGIAPANMGGGGSAGDVGRPAAPAGVNSSDVSAIAPQQAGIGQDTTGASDAAAGAEAVAVDPEHATHAQLVAMIQTLQKQIEMLKSMIENDERREAETLAAQTGDLQQAA
jgi:hypothetical protein